MWLMIKMKIDTHEHAEHAVFDVANKIIMELKIDTRCDQSSL